VAHPPLATVLAEARDLGFLGPPPVEAHLAHGRGLAAVVGAPPARFVDLGTGGGVPGLVLLEMWPEATALLIEANQRRADFLERALISLGWRGRGTVERGRAEAVAREPAFRHRFELVVARGFGPPAVTAECAVGFLDAGGRLVVSDREGPAADFPVRWSSAGLAELGLGPPRPVLHDAARFAVLERVETLGREGRDERWPRRSGVPRKHPLW
jgi:16S rRNA (guanine527-N7)-methyltransferase